MVLKKVYNVEWGDDHAKDLVWTYKVYQVSQKILISVKFIANFTLNFQRNELNLRMSASYAKMVKKSMLTVQFYLDIVPNYV